MVRAAACVVISLAAMGCHPPPDALVDASRIVVVVGAPRPMEPVPVYAFRETPMDELDQAACAEACKGVTRAGERVAACFAAPSNAFAAYPQLKVPLEPSSVRICAIQ